MDLGTVPALGGPPALIVSAFFFLFGFLDLDLALALAFDIFAICDQPRSLTDHSSSFAKARGTTQPDLGLAYAAGLRCLLLLMPRQSMLGLPACGRGLAAPLLGVRKELRNADTKKALVPSK
jgi:hypothetical protein